MSDSLIESIIIYIALTINIIKHINFLRVKFIILIFKSIFHMKFSVLRCIRPQMNLYFTDTVSKIQMVPSDNC